MIYFDMEENIRNISTKYRSDSRSLPCSTGPLCPISWGNKTTEDKMYLSEEEIVFLAPIDKKDNGLPRHFAVDGFGHTLKLIRMKGGRI